MKSDQWDILLLLFIMGLWNLCLRLQHVSVGTIHILGANGCCIGQCRCTPTGITDHWGFGKSWAWSDEAGVCYQLPPSVAKNHLMFEFGDYLSCLFCGLRSFSWINQFILLCSSHTAFLLLFQACSLSLPPPSILYIFLAFSLKTFLDHLFQSSPTPFSGVTPVVSDRIGF